MLYSTEWENDQSRFLRLYETLVPENRESTVENCQKARQIQKLSFSFKQTASRRVSLCTVMAESPKISHGMASPLTRVRPPSTEMVQDTRFQPPAWQWRWKQSYMLSTELLREVTSRTCHYLHRFNELATKLTERNGKPRLISDNVRHPASKTTVDVQSWTWQNQRNWETDWRANQPLRVVCVSEDLKCCKT